VWELSGHQGACGHEQVNSAGTVVKAAAISLGQMGKREESAMAAELYTSLAGAIW
jgi:hypothetical protein